jgi:hypothetical protein
VNTIIFQLSTQFSQLLILTLPSGLRFLVVSTICDVNTIIFQLSTQFSQLLILTLPEDGKDILSEDSFKFWTVEDGRSCVTVNVITDDILNQCIIARTTCFIDISVDVGDHEGKSIRHTV